MNLKKALITCFVLGLTVGLFAQDTVRVSTLNYNSTTRDTVVEFPDGTESYQKILMLYNMRCKGARVSSSANRNLGCGEWDYSCNTYITDSSRRDSFLSSTPEFTVSNFSGTSFNYASKKGYDYYRTVQYDYLVSNTNAESFFPIGTNLQNQFLITKSPQKIYVIYTQAELLAAGLSPGSIDGLNLEFVNNGALSNVRISMANTTIANLASIPSGLNYTRTYQKSTTVINGSTRFQFHEPFGWDGTSNVVLELSHEGASGNINVKSFPALVNQTLSSKNKHHTFLNGSSYFEAETYKGVLGSADRTIDAWIKTSQVNGEICSWGTDRTGEKWVFRLNDNGALRVEVNGGNIIGTTAVNDNAWHHVACVFSGSQVSDIKLYVDGEIEAVGSSTNLAINTTSGLNLRASRGVNNRYFLGEMDELRVWDKAFSAAELKEISSSLVTSSHPDYSNLMLYYPFSHNNLVADLSGNNRNATLFGEEYKSFILGRSINSSFSQNLNKPYVEFFRGSYTATIDSSVINLDSIEKPYHTVKQFSVFSKPNAISNDSIATLLDTQLWNADIPSYVFDENFSKVDSNSLTNNGTVNLSNSLPYYRRYPSSLEIMSFVTPYGIGLDLGAEGKTWVFDMTDFTPILKGKKRMFLSRGGQFQEEMDIQFLFIKGTPTREVKDIVQIWPTSIYQPNYSQILANTNYFPPVTFPTTEKGYKIRSAITGHGQQGEFTPRNHSIIMDGESMTQNVWKACGANPVFPQGGTWIYDRAGWCPGMATDVAEYDISAKVVNKNEITLDYTIDGGSGDSRYIINNQIVTYGDYNFKLDASVTDIISPSNRIEYAKVNPMCVNPSIKFKNTGSDTLKTVTFQYYVNNTSIAKTDVWYGTLNPGQEATHTFPTDQDIWASATGTNDVFHSTILKVNGQSDENPGNNNAYSSFELPVVVPNHVVFFMRANNAGAETSLKLTDDWGQVIYERSALTNGQLYRDTVRLGSGCHQLTVKDSDNDGISFWANQDGSGFIRILKVGGGYNKTLEGDFGSVTNFNFTVNHRLKVTEQEASNGITCYPNPSKDIVYLDGVGLEDASISIYNTLGQTVALPMLQSKDNATLNFASLAKGFYSIQIQIGEKVEVKKVLIQ